MGVPNSASLKRDKDPVKRQIHQYPPGSTLYHQQEGYFKNVKKLEQDFDNFYEIVGIVAKLKNHRMPCVKYNYGLDKET